jgi:CheY-like chemotaxis protein
VSAAIVLRARRSREASRALRARSRQTRRQAQLTLHASHRLRRAPLGPIYCEDRALAALQVLVVDDLDSVRTAFATVLRTAGFDVMEAADGLLALEALKLRQFDAVLLDLGMPVLDGHGVLDRMDEPLPVVVVTAGDYRPVVQAHGERIFGIVTKPVSPEVLIALVGEAATAGRVGRR